MDVLDLAGTRAGVYEDLADSLRPLLRPRVDLGVDVARGGTLPTLGVLFSAAGVLRGVMRSSNLRSSSIRGGREVGGGFSIADTSS